MKRLLKLFLLPAVFLISAIGLSACNLTGGGNNYDDSDYSNRPHPDTDYPPFYINVDKEPTEKWLVPGGYWLDYNTPNPYGQNTSLVRFADVYKSTQSFNIRVSVSRGITNSAVSSIIIQDSVLGECVYSSESPTYKAQQDPSYNDNMIVLTVPKVNFFGTRTFTVRQVNFANGWWKDNVEIKQLIPNTNNVLSVQIGGEVNFHNDFGSAPISAFGVVNSTFNLANCTPERRQGYNFIGWFEKGSETEYTSAQIPAKIVDLYAKFAPKTIKVTYDYGDFDEKNVTFDGVYGDLPTPTKYGYTFGGWQLSQYGFRQEITPTTIVSNESDVTLRSLWTPKKVKVNISEDYNIFPERTRTQYVDFDSCLFNLPYGQEPLGWSFVKWIFPDRTNVTPDSMVTSESDITVIECFECRFFGYGTGTQINPFQIQTRENLITLQLEANRYNSSVYFKLNQNISLGGAWTPIGTNTAPFKANFDGNNKTISGIYFRDLSSANTAGLFGYIHADGIVKNLNVVAGDFDTTGTYGTKNNPTTFSIGALCAINNGRIENCTASFTKLKMIFNLLNENNTQLSIYAGIMVAINNGTIIQTSTIPTTATGAINLNPAVSDLSVGSFCNIYAGGLVGKNEGNISNCQTSATVTVNKNGQADGRAPVNNVLGGFCGINSGSIANCFSTGNVTATSNTTYGNATLNYVGGFVGQNAGGIATSASGGNATVNNNGNTIVPANCAYFVGRETGASAITNANYWSGAAILIQYKGYNGAMTSDYTSTNNVGTTKYFASMQDFVAWCLTDIINV